MIIYVVSNINVTVLQKNILIILVFQIDDDSQCYPLNMFCIPKHYEQDLEYVLIPAGIIDDRSVRFTYKKSCYNAHICGSMQMVAWINLTPGDADHTCQEHIPDTRRC